MELEGEAEQGQDVGLLVTSEDSDTGVESAVVTLNSEEVRSTDADGRITLTMSEVGNEAKIIATSFELTGELEIELSETPEAYKGIAETVATKQGNQQKALTVLVASQFSASGLLATSRRIGESHAWFGSGRGRSCRRK